MSESVLEKNNSLPQNWVKTELENSIQILDGKRKPVNSSEREQRKGDVPYYGATGKVGLIDDYIFNEELVLLGEDGAPFFENFKDKAYLINGKSWVNNHAHVLKGISGLLLNKFLCYYLNQIDYHGYVNGTTRLKLNQSAMRRIPILLAPLNEQKRIVAKIEELFSKIESNLIQLNKVVMDITSLEKSVLNSAFSGKLTQKWRIKNKDLIKFNREEIIEVENILSKKQKFVPVNYENLPAIPEEWYWTRMLVVCSKITDGTHFSPPNTVTGNFQYVTAKNIKSWGIDLSKITYVTKKIHSEIYSRCNPEKGDVLYIKDGVTTGLSAVNELDYPFSMLSSLALLKPNKEILDSYFLKNFLNNPTTFKRLTGRMTGTAIKRIILEKIREAEIPIPSLKEQKEIVKEIDQYSSLTKNMRKPIMEEIRRLTLLKKLILKQAFEGKLVSQDPNDEPAEILLKKIKQEKQKIISQVPKSRKKK